MREHFAVEIKRTAFFLKRGSKEGGMRSIPGGVSTELAVSFAD